MIRTGIMRVRIHRLGRCSGKSRPGFTSRMRKRKKRSFAGWRDRTSITVRRQRSFFCFHGQWIIRHEVTVRSNGRRGLWIYFAVFFFYREVRPWQISGRRYLPPFVRSATSCEKLNHCLPPQNSSAALRKTRCLSCRFSDFYSIAARRSLCTTLVTDHCGQHQGCWFMEKECQKTNVFIFFILFPWTDAPHLPAVEKHTFWWCISTAAWRLLVQTCCQKSEKTTADNSDSARAADLQRKTMMIFREVVQGRTYGR